MAAPVTALFRKRKPRRKRNRNGKKSDCRKWRRIGHFWPQRRVKFSCPPNPRRRRQPRRFTRRNQNRKRRRSRLRNQNQNQSRRQLPVRRGRLLRRKLFWRRRRQNRRPNH